jgi:hypothetical protein
MQQWLEALTIVNAQQTRSSLQSLVLPILQLACGSSSTSEISRALQEMVYQLQPPADISD